MVAELVRFGASRANSVREAPRYDRPWRRNGLAYVALFVDPHEVTDLLEIRCFVPNSSEIVVMPAGGPRRRSPG